MQNVLRYLGLSALLCSISGASWVTFSGDAARTGVDADEFVISPQTASKLQLQWKLKLENQPKELNSLTAPVVLNPVYTNQGAETYLAVGGSSDNVFVVDADTGKLVWQKHFANAVPLPPSVRAGYYFCPNALNDTPLIHNVGGGPSVLVISIDGKLHALNITNGEDRFQPVDFVPAYSKNWSLNVSGNTILTSVSQNCNGTKNGVYGIDIHAADKKPAFFGTAPFGGGVWGRGGVAVGKDGSVYAASGDGIPNPATGRYSDAVVKLDAATLKVLDYYIPPNAAYITRKDLDIGNSTPSIFTYKNRELLLSGGKEGLLTVLDAASLGGSSHNAPLYQTPRLANDSADISGKGIWGGFATFQDSDGTRWVYVPIWGPPSKEAPAFPATNGPANDGSIMAFKVEDKNGSPVLTPAWISRNLNVPEPPAIANGVVFVLSSGEFTRQIDENGTPYTTEQRMAKNTGHAILYALDAKTGKELFSSADAMPSFTHLGGIAVSDGRVFVTTHDSMLYCFGVPGQ